MAGTKAAPKTDPTTNPDLAKAQQASAANHAANIAAHTETQAAIALLQTKLEEAIASDPVTAQVVQAGFELDAYTMDKMLSLVAERNPKLAKLLKKEEKSSDSDSKFLSNDEYQKAIQESGNEALIATAEFQGKMVHWKFWTHRNTRTLILGIGVGIFATIAIPKLVAWFRAEDTTDVEGDAVDFEQGLRDVG